MKNYLLIFLCLTGFVKAYPQQQKKTDKKQQPEVRFDNGALIPITEQQKKDKEITTNFVTTTAWNHTIITYFFVNGTADITGNNEEQVMYR